ncbi:MAG: type II toxin-antitoxin system RelE/ParE family toxin [Coriobacteriia bacterium]|nr:type II toxin-antitoxin system RelE/ParE family toxin [Coriobacteriia bacterium]
MSPVHLDVHEDADRELEDAADYYDRESPGLGSALIDEVELAYDRIRSTPLAAEEVDPGIRRLVLARFPYNLIYEVDDESALVLAIAHQRMRPHYWRSRGQAG